MPNPAKKTCIICQSTYTANSPAQKTCSDGCRYAHMVDSDDSGSRNVTQLQSNNTARPYTPAEQAMIDSYVSSHPKTKDSQ